MDVHIPYAITTQSRLRGIDVLTSQEDGTQELDDSKLLDRASALGKILVTQDDDLLREASARQKQGRPFVGVVCARAMRVTIGQFVVGLDLLARVFAPGKVE